MADIYSSHCSEPWDADELHEVYLGGFNGTKKVPYANVAKLFGELDCGAFQSGQQHTLTMVVPKTVQDA